MVFSPLGLQPKKVQGQYRVIHHLSFPKGQSVNDGIPDASATVQYATVGQAIQYIVQMGAPHLVPYSRHLAPHWNGSLKQDSLM